MLPDMNNAHVVAYEMTQDRIRRAEQRRLMQQLPPKPRRGARLQKRIAYVTGAALLSMGKKLQRMSETELEYDVVGNEAA